mgnify:CR=1 FL=1
MDIARDMNEEELGSLIALIRLEDMLALSAEETPEDRVPRHGFRFHSRYMMMKKATTIPTKRLAIIGPS